MKTISFALLLSGLVLLGACGASEIEQLCEVSESKNCLLNINNRGCKEGLESVSSAADDRGCSDAFDRLLDCYRRQIDAGECTEVPTQCQGESDALSQCALTGG